jgi:hypothetical protein
MQMAKKDATLVVFSLNGVVCGAHAVQSICGVSQEHQNTKNCIMKKMQLKKYHNDGHDLYLEL